ncbi:hypothetical protein NGRA_2019 [Nosema granulosis]|uniref:Peptidase A2 domain-containing protein n=1 Tax=Nosema granulosis TaxID=83296 RepID=A0A9P6GXG1_9MICR|nr:hypothetical protein NGRA_2019 [Nosema granulosis]
MNGSTHIALLDTGADVSLINIEKIQDKTRIENIQEKIKTASGTEIKIRGVIRNLEIFVFGKKIKFSPLVCQGLPNYTILGIDVLVPNSELLTASLSKPHTHQKKATSKNAQHIVSKINVTTKTPKSGTQGDKSNNGQTSVSKINATYKTP